MSFQRYESRPITRLAHEITEADRIVSAGVGLLRLITPEGEKHTFTYSSMEVQTGDFVVYQDEDDIYHCPRGVFLERNIVPEDEAKQEDGELSEDEQEYLDGLDAVLRLMSLEAQQDEDEEKERAVVSQVFKHTHLLR